MTSQQEVRKRPVRWCRGVRGMKPCGVPLDPFAPSTVYHCRKCTELMDVMAVNCNEP